MTTPDTAAMELRARVSRAMYDCYMDHSDYKVTTKLIDDMADAAISALSARPTAEGDVPSGWVLVPREPTQAMAMTAVRLDLSYMPDQQAADRAAIYRAMLAAAPPTPAAVEGERGWMTRAAGVLELVADGAEVIPAQMEQIAANLMALATKAPEAAGAVACHACGGRDLAWDVVYRNNSDAADGRLRVHDVSCVFVIGCNSCSETIKVIPAEQVAAATPLTHPAPARAVDEDSVFRLACWMATKDGHDDVHHLIWEGSPPEPWGEVWQRYERDAHAALTAALSSAAAQPGDGSNG